MQTKEQKRQKRIEKRRRLEALAAVVGRRVIHRKLVMSVVGGRIVRGTEDRDVILMAVVDGWGLVRRPGCLPYAASASELIVAGESPND